jgi:hypothetical protein
MFKKPSKSVAPAAAASSSSSSSSAPPKKTWGRKVKKPAKFPVDEAIFNPENPVLPPLFTKCVAYLEKNGTSLWASRDGGVCFRGG